MGVPRRPRSRKRLGQHFLSDRRILARIAGALDPPAGARVLEIGPGGGTLTRVLLARPGGLRLAAIEKDRELGDALHAALPAVRVRQGDALELDWRDAAGAGLGEPLYLIGNIPYYITSPLLAKALAPPRPERIVFLVQEEVADRLAAAPGDPAYGALSVGVQVLARVEWLFRVPAGAFRPPPQVDSAVVRITPLRSPLVPDQEIESFRRLVVGLFGYRRKQLLRGLRELTGWPPERVRPELEACGLAATARPETVLPGEFVRLHARLIDAGWGRD
ncbi:MAG: 16S rRNA (adenine(1518)-N(6)/adenine(1519)-N(6))-dimethyltransferase RsmA [Gemmatimonadales bacterium]